MIPFLPDERMTALVIPRLVQLIPRAAQPAYPLEARCRGRRRIGPVEDAACNALLFYGTDADFERGVKRTCDKCGTDNYY